MGSLAVGGLSLCGRRRTVGSSGLPMRHCGLCVAGLQPPTGRRWSSRLAGKIEAHPDRERHAACLHVELPSFDSLLGFALSCPQDPR